MNLITVQQFMNPYDQLRATLIGELALAERMAPFIRAGLEALAQEMPTEAIDASFQQLRDDDAAAVAMHYGVWGEDRHSLEDIAQRTGKSRDTVRSREVRGIMKLRTILRGEGKGHVSEKGSS